MCTDLLYNFSILVLKNWYYNTVLGSRSFNFIQQSWYLNFSVRFMKNILFEQKKRKLWNKWHFVENETEIMDHDLKMQ